MFNDLFWALYWIDVLSAIPKDIVWGGAAGGFFGLLAGCVRAIVAEERNEDVDSLKVSVAIGMKVLCVIWPLSILLSFVPTKQTMYMMLGVKATDNVVNSELGQKLQKVIDLQIEEYIGKLTPKKDK